MNIETRKYNLINWIMNLQSEGLIEYLELLKHDRTESWKDLPQEVKDGINEAINQAANGEFINHNDQVKKYLG